MRRSILATGCFFLFLFFLTVRAFAEDEEKSSGKASNLMEIPIEKLLDLEVNSVSKKEEPLPKEPAEI